jgi:DNA helicase HerA-like ATPase
MSLNSILSRMNVDLKPAKITKYIESIDIMSLIQKEQYVGEIVNLAYESAKVQINDAYRKRVGGVPAQCFLLATRITEEDNKNKNFYEEEDCSVILLRVVDSASLPGDQEKERILVENAERSHGSKEHWDTDQQDAMTKKLLSFGAIQCRVLGTFYMEKDKDKYSLKFGNDLSNFYPNRGLKVYKPTGMSLEAIVNFGINEQNSVKIGSVRYSSTNRKNQGVSEVTVAIDPKDLIAQKTAVFGMTRTGKSNTVKIIAKSIYQLRQKAQLKIGQLILDVNGEYANDNRQDINDETGKAESLKNVWKVPVDGEMGSPDDVVTYGLISNKNDPNRIVMKINFYDDTLLQIGKELIDDKLQSDSVNNVQYVKSFTSVYFEPLEGMEYGEKTRELRRRIVYKTILNISGFKDKEAGKVFKNENSLFSEQLLASLRVGIKDYEDLSDNKQREYKNALNKYNDCADILEKYNQHGTTYSELAKAFEYLLFFIKDPISTYNDFERAYILRSTTGSQWLDVNLSSLLETFQYKNAAKKIAKANIYHDPKSAKKDYAQLIYEDLEKGRLVIVDQALGDSDLNKLAAERILRKIFEENSKQFSSASTPSAILIYIEEAHNLMPKGSEEDNTNIWARVAKEGAKFNIGMIYSTQEVSSIQKNILKNTTNWFISHLNNKEEIRALSDYYDFADFASSILQAEDKGFIRMKTKTNRFVVPIQVDKFQIDSQGV